MSKETEWLRRIKSSNGMRASLLAKEPEKKEEAKPLGKEIPVDLNAGKQGFSKVAGMDNLKKLVIEGFINVLKNPTKAAHYGISVPNILLYGPAGCGKTFFAERVAEEVGINFMKVSPDDLSSIYIHGTQKKIGELFKKAESKAPTLLFLDEFDCMAPQRTNDPNRQHQTDDVDEFLTMLNETSKRGIYVIAATNHPENIDKSILRTGRIDEKIYVPMPDVEMRKSLFRIELESRPISDDIDYDTLAQITEGYNCSDINYIVKVAARQKFNSSINSATDELIYQKDIEGVISHVSPSVTEKDIRTMERTCQEFAPKDSMSNKYTIGFK